MAKSITSSPIFSGEFRHSLDDKNRITIPARWRSGETEEVYVVKNPKRACLTVMPQEVFKRIGEDAKEKSSPAEHRIFITHFYSQAKNCTIDKQGRLLLPEDYCKAAGLRSDVVLTGGSDRFDLWSPASWKAVQDEQMQTYEKVSEAIGI